MDEARRLPLAVTTSDRRDPRLARRAQAAAAEARVPYVERTHKQSLAELLTRRAAALVVFEADAVALVDERGTLRYSPGLALLRVKQIDRGTHEDMLLRQAGLLPGEHVLDCTFGLGGDAQVAARCVGPSGRVIALEKSLPLYLLGRYGLELLPPHPMACPITVLHRDAAAELAQRPEGSFDVVLLDPMFERARPSSAAFETLRRHADYSPLTPAIVAQAQRVARRAVVLKGSRYSSDFKKLGVQPAPARPSATVLWAVLPGRAASARAAEVEGGGHAQ